MQRRQYLSFLAVFGAGCAGGEIEVGNTQAPTNTTETSPDPVTTASRVEVETRDWEVPRVIDAGGASFVTYVIGRAEDLPPGAEPHYVVIENRADSARDLQVRVQDQAAETPALDVTLQFPAHGLAELRFQTPAWYTVEVTGAGAMEAILVPETRFDCNASTDGIVITETGTGETGRTSTQFSCETPTR